MPKYDWKTMSMSVAMLGKLPESYQHAVNGKHGGFSGHRYRRGKQRCAYCGAPSNAPDKTMAERCHEQMERSIFGNLNADLSL